MELNYLYFTVLSVCSLSLLRAKLISTSVKNNDVYIRADLGGNFGSEESLNLSLPTTNELRSISWSVLKRKLEIARRNTEASSYPHQMNNLLSETGFLQQSKVSNGWHFQTKAEFENTSFPTFAPHFNLKFAYNYLFISVCLFRTPTCACINGH